MQSYSSEGERARHACTPRRRLREFVFNMLLRVFADLLSAADSPEQGSMRTLTAIVDSISAADAAVAFPMDIPK